MPSLLGSPIREMSNFGMRGAGQPGEVDGDDDVDLTDLAILLSSFGEACP